MRRRAAALVFALLLVFQMAASSAGAAETIYFTAINDNMLPLSEESMPFWSNGYLYVDSAIFSMAANAQGKALGIYRSRNVARQLLMLSSDQETLKILFFDLAAGTVQDNQGISYSPAAIQRNNVVFVPLVLMKYYFDIDFNRIKVPHGYLVRIRNEKATLSDEAFADAATYLMEPQYNQYIQSKTPQESQTPAAPEETPAVEPAGGGKSVYLCLEASDGAVTGQLLDELDRTGSRAAFYCTETFLREQGDLLRRMTATGHSIGLIADGSDPERTLTEQLEEGNRLLSAATCGKTRLVWLRNAADQGAGEVTAAGYRCLAPDLDRSGESLKGAYQAAVLLRRVTERRGDVSVWLADSADAAGLRAFLSAAGQAEDRCLAITETV